MKVYTINQLCRHRINTEQTLSFAECNSKLMISTQNREPNQSHISILFRIVCQRPIQYQLSYPLSEEDFSADSSVIGGRNAILLIKQGNDDCFEESVEVTMPITGNDIVFMIDQITVY